MIKAIVHVPLADLRKEPQATYTPDTVDLFQESQLLYNEVVDILDTHTGGWVHVQAIEQPKNDQGRWIGYPGWVQERFLSPLLRIPYYSLIVVKPWASLCCDDGSIIPVTFGTRFERIDEDGQFSIVRLAHGGLGKIDRSVTCHYPFPMNTALLIEMAKQFLGQPYRWGGRSAHRSDWMTISTGVDCSGLIQLLFRIFGIHLPRDAHDQYLFCQAIEKQNLRSGDLIFLNDTKKPKRMGHVLLYVNDEEMFESVLAMNRVRKVTCKEKWGYKLADTPSSQIYIGSVAEASKINY